ncbi:hypothetical protein N9A28_00480 [Sulfurimonas sp.]|nr:hypothetical protein [Sulfurimonas sp.]
MQRAYSLAVFYYLLFSILLVMSAVLIFETKIGFSINGILDYYLGNEEKYILKQSFESILKINLPHLFSFAALAMVLLHFLVFTKHRFSKRNTILIYATFITAFLEIFTPMFIINGFEFFAYLKLLSFFLFLSLVLYISWLLFISIINE